MIHKLRALVLWLQGRERQRAAARARAQKRDLRLQKLHRQLQVELMCANQIACFPEDRRVVHRAKEGWKGSTLYGFVDLGDHKTYNQKFRITRKTMEYITEKLTSSGYIKDSMPRDPMKQVTARFKVASCMYYMAHGCCDAERVGDVGSLGKSTIDLYIDEFIEGCIQVLRPIYMPGTPPSPAVLARVRAEFKKRRGLDNIALAVDGTHVPFRGGVDYRNYKGWTSLLALAWVNSFYMFVDADVGAAGRAGDNGVLSNSWLLGQLKQNRAAWLGAGGMVAADGGASDGGDLLLNPIPDARQPEDCWYNFCHSSTRFFVEETFGRCNPSTHPHPHSQSPQRP